MDTNTEENRNQFLNLNGATVCYDDMGSGAIPIVFIHGFPFNKSTWQAQVQMLKKKHRVIAYDLRGFGASTSGNEVPSMELFADDLIQLLDALKVKKAIVCGLSMGGYILLNAVTRYPERFKAMVLCDTQCIADSTETKEKRAKAIAQIEEGKLKEYAQAFVKGIFFEETLQKSPQLPEKIEKTIITTSESAIIGTLKALANRSDMCSALNEIKLPTLIICGEHDAVTPPAQSQILNEGIFNSKYVRIGKAGHMSNLEQPELFNQSLNDFLLHLEKQ